MYNSCYYSEPEMNEIAEALLDIFRKNEKNDRQVAFVFAFEIVYLFIYLFMQHVNTHCSISIKKYILVQFPFLYFGIVVVVFIDSHYFLYLFCRSLFPSPRPSP